MYMLMISFYVELFTAMTAHFHVIFKDMFITALSIGINGENTPPDYLDQQCLESSS